MNDHDIWQYGEACDWRYVINEIEVELLIERRIDGIRGRRQQKSIAIGGRTHDRFSGDIAARTGSVVDNEWLPEPFGQPLPYDAHDDIAPRTSRKSDDHAHRPGGIGLRASNARDCRQRGSAGGQMQKSTAGKF